MGKLFLFCLAGVLVLGCTVSCKSRVAYQDERSMRAVVEHYQVKNQLLEEKGPLSLQDCIAAGVTNTLAARFRSTAEKKADPQAAVEVLKLLPSFRFQDGLAARSDAPGMTVRRPNYYNIDFMLGVLDFGLGYWYSQEYLYEKAYREQLMRKIAGKIQFEVSRAYYRADALQTTRFQLEMQLERLRMQLASLQRQKGKPELAAKVLRKMVKLEQTFHKMEDACKNSNVELRTLMGLYPDAAISLQSVAAKACKPMTLPELPFMEQIALSRRPELFMGDIRKKISQPVCQGLIRCLLAEEGGKKGPSPDCGSLGARALYDLLQTPCRFAGKGAKAKERLVAIHSYAGALAVMAQVRMAYSEYVTAQELCRKNKQALADCEALLKKSRAGTWEYADMSVDTLRMKIRLAESTLQSRIAGSRLLYTLGISKLDARLTDTIAEELADAAKEAAKDLKEARQQYNEKQVALLAAELKMLQEKEAARKAAEEEELRKETNKEIDAICGSKRNPALWKELGK